MPFLTDCRQQAEGTGAFSRIDRAVLPVILLKATLRVANDACFRV